MISHQFTVIVAVDDPALQKEVVAALKVFDHDIYIVNDSDTAWDAVRSAHGERLLLNLDMGRRQGGGSDGTYLLQKMLRHKIMMPTVVIARDGASAAALAAGIPFVRLILSPGDLEYSARRINEALTPPADIEDVRSALIDGRLISSRSPRIFLIHGRNHFHRDRVANILREINAIPIILEHQVVDSRDAIDILYENARNVDFAVAFFTGDDIGRLNNEDSADKKRARQNVIFEVGLFMGVLSRKKVVIFWDNEAEKPSDIGGIVTLPVSENDDILKMKIIQIFNELRLPVKMS